MTSCYLQIQQFYMNSLTAIYFTALIFILPLCAKSQEKDVDKILVVTNVTIIDTKGSLPKAHMTVMIINNVITNIGEKNKIKIPKGAFVVDASNKFIIPGLWDMHVHDVCDSKWGKSVFMPMYIANGVTGVRDMGGPNSGVPDTVFKRREEIKEGKLLAPRIVAAGYFIMGDVRGPREAIRVSNDSDGRHAVDFIKNAGADFVKVKELVPREAYFAIADEARKQTIPLVGHVPFSIDAVEAVNAGQKSIEHLDGIWFTCSTEGNQLRQDAFDSELKMFQGKSAQSATFQKIIYALDTAMKTYSEQKADSAFTRFVSLNTFVCPTLTASQALANSGDTTFQNDDRLKYIPASIAHGWDPKLNGRLQQLSSNDFVLLQNNFQKSLQLVKTMKNAGIKLLAGTDTSPKASSIPYLFPGFTLLDELQLYVRAGLTPLEALQTATLNPAKFLDLEKECGTVEIDKRADLVLLEANPLDDIGNITKINAVIVNGRFINKDQLQKMLEDAQIAAKK